MAILNSALAMDSHYKTVTVLDANEYMKYA